VLDTRRNAGAGHGEKQPTTVSRPSPTGCRPTVVVVLAGLPFGGSLVPTQPGLTAASTITVPRTPAGLGMLGRRALPVVVPLVLGFGAGKHRDFDADQLVRCPTTGSRGTASVPVGRAGRRDPLVVRIGPSWGSGLQVTWPERALLPISDRAT